MLASDDVFDVIGEEWLCVLRLPCISVSARRRSSDSALCRSRHSLVEVAALEILRLQRHSGSVKNGTKIRRIWDVFCLAGATGFSLGFQPWETSKKKRFALKGREITWAICVRLLPKGRGYLLGRDTISRWLK